MWVLLALVGAAAAWLFLRQVETVNGVVHFTKDGRRVALGRLQNDTVTTTAAQIAGANLTLQVTNSQPLLGAVSGYQAVLSAEQAGGVVLLSDNYDGTGAAVLVVCSPGQEKTVATPGSGLAVLTIVPG